jgi:hypothetical protein
MAGAGTFFINVKSDARIFGRQTPDGVARARHHFARRVAVDFPFHWLVLVGLFLLAGCASFHPTRDDQLRSWQEVGPTQINAALSFPEIDGFTAQQIDARKYLFVVSVGVLAAEDASAYERIDQLIAAAAEARSRPAGEGEGETPAASAASQIMTTSLSANKGAGVPITMDGYIVTAAHVVSFPEILVLHFEIAERQVIPRAARARVVFADQEADFALLKCDITTPRHLEMRSDAIEKRAPMFSGGWWNERGAGRLIAVREFRSSQGHTYRRLRSSVPMLHGDSGSALIDSEGRLLGVTVHSLWGRFWRQPPKSDAVMLDPGTLKRLIQEDRAKTEFQVSVEQTHSRPSN